MKSQMITQTRIEKFNSLLSYVLEICKCALYLMIANIKDANKSIKRIILSFLLLVLAILVSQPIHSQNCSPLILEFSEIELEADTSMLVDTLWYEIIVYNEVAEEAINDISLKLANYNTGSDGIYTATAILPCSSISFGPFYTIALPLDYKIAARAEGLLSNADGSRIVFSQGEMNYSYEDSLKIDLFASMLAGTNSDFGELSNSLTNINLIATSGYSLSNFEVKWIDFYYEEKLFEPNFLFSSDLPYTNSITLNPGDNFDFNVEFSSSSFSIVNAIISADVDGLLLPDGSPMRISHMESASQSINSPELELTYDFTTDTTSLSIGDTVFATVTFHNNYAYPMDSLVSSINYRQYSTNYDPCYSDYFSLSNIDTTIHVTSTNPLMTGNSLVFPFWYIHIPGWFMGISHKAAYTDTYGVRSRDIVESIVIVDPDIMNFDLTVVLDSANLCAGDSLTVESGYIVNTGSTAVTDIELVMIECSTGNCNQNLLNAPNVFNPGDTLFITSCSMLPYYESDGYLHPILHYTPVDADGNLLPEYNCSFVLQNLPFDMEFDADVDFYSDPVLQFWPADSTETVSVILYLENTGCLSLNDIYINSNANPLVLDWDTLMYLTQTFDAGDSIAINVPTNLPPWDDPLYMDSTFLANSGIYVSFVDAVVGGVDTMLLDNVSINYSFDGIAIHEGYPDIPIGCEFLYEPIVHCNPECFCEIGNCIAPVGNIISFSTSTGASGGGVLPVELLSYTGSVESDYNLLEWTTASEIENDYFTLYKSLDGLHFEYLDRVQGNGTKTSSSDYAYRDYTIEDGITYYRLEQTDYDGTKDKLGVVALDRSLVQFDMTLSPIPATDVIYVKSNSMDNMAFSILDLSGREISMVHADSGAISISHLSPGIYFILAETAEGTVAKKFIKE